MLDLSTAIREALVHSIPISEVKNMKTDVLRAMKGSLSGIKLWTLFVGSILTIFKKEKLHRLWNSFCNISAFGINKNWSLLAILFFLSSHTHSYLLILLKYKNQVFCNLLTPKVPWLCFSKNTQKLPPWRLEKGHAKKKKI
jgi:hypothetical protein